MRTTFLTELSIIVYSHDRIWEFEAVMRFQHLISARRNSYTRQLTYQMDSGEYMTDYVIVSLGGR